MFEQQHKSERDFPGALTGGRLTELWFKSGRSGRWPVGDPVEHRVGEPESQTAVCAFYQFVATDVRGKKVEAQPAHE